MSEIYLTADLHFGDANIMAYENRPFNSVEEMDKALIENWNKKVPRDAEVYVLGDVGAHDPDKMKSIITQLNGTKKLIIGNHDANRTDEFWKRMGFDQVYRTDGIILDKWYVLNHYPPEYINEKVPWVWFYGHVHGSEMYQTITSYSACVCTERWGYAPVNMKYLISLIGEERKRS